MGAVKCTCQLLHVRTFTTDPEKAKFAKFCGTAIYVTLCFYPVREPLASNHFWAYNFTLY